jgi:hypothetical protein
MQHAVRVNPENFVDRFEISAFHHFLCDAQQASGDVEGAVRTYRTGLALTEPLLAARSGTVVAAALFMLRKVSEYEARRGNREESLAFARRVLLLVDPEKSPARPLPANSVRALAPRGPAAMGIAYATLANGPAEHTQDRYEARSWLTKSLEGYRALQAGGVFSEIHRREMAVVEQTLERLK